MNEKDNTYDLSPVRAMYDQVIDILTEWEVTPQEDPEDSPLTRIIYEEKLSDLIESVAVIVIFRENFLQVFTRYQTPVPEDAVPEILKYINTLNEHLDFGSFVLMDNCITFRNHFSYDDETEVSSEVLESILQKGTNCFFDYGDGFVRISDHTTDAATEGINTISYNLLLLIEDCIDDDAVQDNDFSESDVHRILQEEWLPILFYNPEYTRDFLKAMEYNGCSFLAKAYTGSCEYFDRAYRPEDFSVSKITSADRINHLKIVLPKHDRIDGLFSEIHLLYTDDLVSKQFFMIEYDASNDRKLISTLLPDPDDREYYGEAETDSSQNDAAIEKLFRSENGL